MERDVGVVLAQPEQIRRIEVDRIDGRIADVDQAAAGDQVALQIRTSADDDQKATRAGGVGSIGWPTQIGEYQIGDVQARSCCFIGTSSLIFTPKRTWSYAVQRGVGISITRA